jgi:hypothetical protein
MLQAAQKGSYLRRQVVLSIDRDGKRLTRLAKLSLPEAGLLERADIQRMIQQDDVAFFEELGEPLLLIGEELRPASAVEDRIDLLAIDRNGSTVIIEIKRGNHKLHLLQALSYAAMMSKWEPNQIVEARAQLLEKTVEETEEEIEEFLDVDIASLNDIQRIMLLAESYDYAVLVTSEWLSETYEVDIRCYRLELAADGDREYLSIVRIFPAPEISEHAARRGRVSEPRPSKWPDWETALSSIKNTAVKEFFEKELAAGRDNYLRKRILRYKMGGRRRLSISARGEHAYAWQTGRFHDDLVFWKEHVGDQIDVEAVKRGLCLRFYLRSKTDFERFRNAVMQELAGVQWQDKGEMSVDEENEVPSIEPD